VSFRPLCRTTAGLALSGVALVAGLLAGCGDDDGGGGAAETTEITSSYEEVPMADVLEQLPLMLAAGEVAATEAAAGDFDAVLDRYAELHEVWVGIEGTVKATDRDLYSAIETAQSLIKDGGENEDAGRVAIGVTDQADMIGIFVESTQ
jgi:hypothetical protein